jgi:hypothetical protein
MARELKYTRNIGVLLTLMLVKQQLSVYYSPGITQKVVGGT